jgi:Tol biopolymer transport system component
VFYQSMGQDRYVLRWLHAGRNQKLVFDGHAFHPRLAPDGESIDFELAANGKSTMMRFYPRTGQTSSLALPLPIDAAVQKISPDGKWLAFESVENGPTQIGLRDLATGRQILLTGGNCTNSSPAWELDSHSILFASDCGRGSGLFALYRAQVPGAPN